MTAAQPSGADDRVAIEVLYGPDHPDLDTHTVRAVGPDAAVSLSAGRYPKAVQALDANEDATVGVAGPNWTMVAVADGHIGADAAVAAIDALARGARRLAADRAPHPRQVVADLVAAAADAVDDARRDASGARRDSATALSVALVCGRAAWTSTYGDTSVVRVRGAQARVVSRIGPFLVGSGARVQPRRVRLRAGDHLVVLCDGVSDHLGRDWPVEVAQRVTSGSAPADAAAAVLLAAMDGAAGDHMSCAVVRCR